MIDRQVLLGDLQRVARDLIEDLRGRTDAVEEVRRPVRGLYDQARAAGRTDRSYEEWREDLLAQVAVGWTLGTVFVRFCEDNACHAPCYANGPPRPARTRNDPGISAEVPPERSSVRLVSANHRSASRSRGCSTAHSCATLLQSVLVRLLRASCGKRPAGAAATMR